MQTNITPEIKEIIEAGYYRPAISLIMPFEPKMCLKEKLNHSIKIAVDEVRRELLKNYPGEIVSIVMAKLKEITQNLNFNTHKKSIAIYVSPVFQKLIYLDITVETRIMIDESFEIRDLLYSKKQLHKYLVLLLSEKESHIFLGNVESFLRIVSNSPGSVEQYINDIPERVANFSDVNKYHEIIMDKFLLHIDKGLDIILNAYHLPLFVMGTKKMLGHFKKLTRHTGSVIEYVHGNYDESSFTELRVILEPHIGDWKKVMQKDILNQLDDAAGKRKLSIGMKAVWKEAMDHKGRLLVVEKDYMYAAEKNNEEDINKAAESYNKFSYIKDAVDELIEKVLESGGDVEFVDKGLLEPYHHIALIQHY